MTDKSLLDIAVDGVVNNLGMKGTLLAVALIWIGVLLFRRRRP